MRHRTFLLRAHICLLAFALLFNLPVLAASPDLVISQIYGAGGNSGATYKYDYIELFNRGTVAVSLNGLSLQYASATGTGNFGGSASQLTVLPNVSVAPGQRFLVQEAGGTNGVDLLTTPDYVVATSPINMAAAGGKVALVRGVTSLGCNGSSTPCSPTALALIIDLVGVDGSNFFEGSGAAPSTSTTQAVFRKGGGCIDTDDNKNDFELLAASPRNSQSALAACNAPTNPVGSGSANPASVEAGMTTLLTVSVTPGGYPVSTGIVVVADLSAIGGNAAQPLFDDGSNGDAVAGDNIFSFQTTVASGTAAGTKMLNFVVKDAELRTGSSSITLAVTAPPTPYGIHDIQGSGLSSPHVGEIVSTSGIVTALKSNGFFLQTPDNAADADSSTSEAVFVYAGKNTAGITVGDLVDVKGPVSEYYGLTEISASSTNILSSGNALPAAINLTPAEIYPAMSATYLERYEGMRVHADSLTVVAPTDGSYSDSTALAASNGKFYTVLTGTPRPFREPGVLVGSTLPTGAPTGIPSFDGNPELLRVDSDGQVGAPKADVSTGAVLSGVTGVLDYTYGAYALLPDSTLSVSAGNIAVPVPERAEREFTVASFNLLHFYDTVTADGLELRMTKLSAAVRNILRSPDIIGVVEMKNLELLQRVADRVNADSIAAGQGDPGYVAQLIPGKDSINVGFLLRNARMQDVEVTQVGLDDTMPGSTSRLNDRPPLVLRAKLLPPNSQPFPVTVIVNHLRSLIDVDTIGSAGDFARSKRRLQAEFLANLIAQHQQAGENVISVGDYNAYEFNDGYVDVLGIIDGAPALPDTVLLAGSDLVDPDLVDLITLLPPDQRYTYVENGNAQTLDHIVTTQGLLTRPYRFVVAHLNADYPQVWHNDPARPERVSDHDVPVGYFTFPDPVADLATTLTALETTVVSGQTQSYTANMTNSGPDAAEGVTFTYTVPEHASFRSLAAPADWSCTTPVVGGKGQIVCTLASLASGSTAQFTIDVAVDCVTPPGTLLNATASISGAYDPNLANNTASAASTVSNPPPVISAFSADKLVMWPPLKMVLVTLNYSLSDNCDPSLLPRIKVTPAPTPGRTGLLWVTGNSRYVLLYSDRPTSATVTLSTTDSVGQTASQSVTVTVPR